MIKVNKIKITSIVNSVFYKILFFINNINALIYTFKVIKTSHYLILNLL